MQDIPISGGKGSKIQDTCTPIVRQGKGVGRGSRKGVRQRQVHPPAQSVPLDIMDITSSDRQPKIFPFTPTRPVGVYLTDNTDPNCPAALFKLFFDTNIVQSICDASNEYAESLKDVKPIMYRYLKTMTRNDLYQLIGILIHFGYRKIPRYRFAWSCRSLCYDPIIANIMSRNRFEGLMSFLHIVNKDTEKQLKDEGDKLAKVRPLNDHINLKCKEFYQPNMEVSVDERMVLSKARFSYKQYIRNKPTKWGFKLWCLCDSHNGYTINFSVYRGKNGELRSGKGLGYDVVLSLMRDYLNQGYCLYIDNFYTSPTLALDLFDEGTHITGTLSVSRKEVPAEVVHTYKSFSSNSTPRGKGAYVRNDNIVYAIWRDTKYISVLSSKHQGHSESVVVRNTRFC